MYDQQATLFLSLIKNTPTIPRYWDVSNVLVRSSHSALYPSLILILDLAYDPLLGTVVL